MVDVRGDVLRPPHGTTPAAVKDCFYMLTYEIQPWWLLNVTAMVPYSIM